MNEIEINGITYRQREQEKSNSKISSNLKTIMFGAMAMSAMADFGGGGYDRQLPEGINIVEEYKLIQLKKSKLSKWERDAVVRTFEYNYVKI